MVLDGLGNIEGSNNRSTKLGINLKQIFVLWQSVKPYSINPYALKINKR